MTGRSLWSRLRDPFMARRFGIGWWSVSGLVAGASAGADELRQRDQNVMIYEVPKYGVTVAVARGERAAELRAWFDRRFTTSDSPQAVAPE